MKPDAMVGKELGALAELKFYFKAYEHGLTVSRPFGDNAPYDFVVDHNGVLSRVQVKSTFQSRKNGNGFSVVAHKGGGKEAYTKEDVDFIAVYLGTVDLWYIIPILSMGGKKTLTLYTEATGVYGNYLNAWNLLMSIRRGDIVKKPNIRNFKDYFALTFYDKATGRGRDIHSLNGQRFFTKDAAREARNLLFGTTKLNNGKVVWYKKYK